MEQKLNQITVIPVKTPYGYEEQYLAVDGVPVTELLEDFVRESGDGGLKRFGSMKGLCPAWGSGLQNRGRSAIFTRCCGAICR